MNHSSRPKSLVRERNPELIEKIDNLISGTGKGENADLVREIIITSLKVYEDSLDRGDVKILNTAIRELRHSLKVFDSYRSIRKVAIFGSARTPRDAGDFKLAEAFAREIVKRNWMVITGAASGIMQAGNEGAGHKKSFGLNIQLPFEQEANPVMLEDPKLLEFKYFFTRKLMFLRESHATVLCPGGYGTHDEGFETLTLVQTGKTEPRPIVCLDEPNSSYWRDFIQFIRKQLLAQKMVCEEDIDMMLLTHDPIEAADYIVGFYKNYHSLRYIHDLLVLRLEKPLTEEQIGILNDEFKEMIKKGSFMQRLKPYEEEKTSLHTLHLTRLAFYFKRDHFSRLNLLIRRINNF